MLVDQIPVYRLDSVFQYRVEVQSGHGRELPKPDPLNQSADWLLNLVNCLPEYYEKWVEYSPEK